MRNTSLSVTAVATTLALVCHSAAYAQVTRTWVSGVGSDVNPCSRASPCRTFNRAHGRTIAGGEITVLSAGNFGAVTITKSISINNGIGSAHADEAAILAPVDDPAITINAGPNDIVNLRGLVLEGVGVGKTGIQFIAGGSLHIQNCVIRAFRHAGEAFGIRFEPRGASELYVSDTLIANNGVGESGGAILIRPALQLGPIRAGSAKVVLNRLQVEKNSVGIEATSTVERGNTPLPNRAGDVDITIRDTLVSGSTSIGIKAHGRLAFGEVRMMIDHSAIVHNSTAGPIALDPTTGFISGTIGILADGAHATVRITNSTIAGNNIGLRSANRGILEYSNNNTIRGNDVNFQEPPENL